MDKKLYHLGAICAFGLAASVVLNGIAFFINMGSVWLISRVLIVIFALGFFPALAAKVRTVHPGWAAWMINLVYLGVAAEAIRYLGNLPFNTVFLFFGGLSLSSLVFNILALKHDLWPKALAWIGVVMSILLIGVILSSMIESLAFLNMVSAGLGAVVLYPIWLVWLGLRFQKE